MKFDPTKVHLTINCGNEGDLRKPPANSPTYRCVPYEIQKRRLGPYVWELCEKAYNAGFRGALEVRLVGGSWTDHRQYSEMLIDALKTAREAGMTCFSDADLDAVRFASNYWFGCDPWFYVGYSFPIQIREYASILTRFTPAQIVKLTKALGGKDPREALWHETMDRHTAPLRKRGKLFMDSITGWHPLATPDAPWDIWMRNWAVKHFNEGKGDVLGVETIWQDEAWAKPLYPLMASVVEETMEQVDNGFFDQTELPGGVRLNFPNDRVVVSQQLGGTAWAKKQLALGRHITMVLPEGDQTLEQFLG